MRAYGIKIYIRRKSERYFSVSLYAVAVKYNIFVDELYRLGERVHVVDRARLVVDVHDRYETDVSFGDRFQQLVFIDGTVFVERYEFYVYPPVLQFEKRFVNGGVFALRRQCGSPFCRRKDCRIVAFGAARSKNAFMCGRAQTLQYKLTRGVQFFIVFKPSAV